MKKLNNNGFSLIELIIVMAIMAILTVAIAPQYLKYVERSRKSTDVQTMAAVVSAIDIYAADPVVGGLGTDADGKTITIVPGTPFVPKADSDSAATFIDKALNNAGIKSVDLKSKEWVADTSAGLGLKVTLNSGVPTYTMVNQHANLDILKGDTEQ